MQKLVSRMVRLFMVFAAACCIMAGAGGAMSVKDVSPAVILHFP